jgi:hypothetical protein
MDHAAALDTLAARNGFHGAPMSAGRQRSLAT